MKVAIEMFTEADVLRGSAHFYCPFPRFFLPKLNFILPLYVTTFQSPSALIRGQC